MKIFEGIIISTGSENTAMVEVFRKTPHPLYKKLIKRSKKYKADTASFTPQVGNIVRITETRPISKDKYFKIIKILGETVIKKESIEAIDEILEEAKPVRKTKESKEVKLESSVKVKKIAGKSVRNTKASKKTKGKKVISYKL